MCWNLGKALWYMRLIHHLFVDQLGEKSWELTLKSPTRVIFFPESGNHPFFSGFEHYLQSESCSSKILQNLWRIHRRFLGELPHALPWTSGLSPKNLWTNPEVFRSHLQLPEDKLLASTSGAIPPKRAAPRGNRFPASCSGSSPDLVFCCFCCCLSSNNTNLRLLEGGAVIINFGFL